METNTCTALAQLPVCPSNSGHGHMVLRPSSSQTKEQLFCGVWYDCKDVDGGRCRSSVLYESAGLKAQLAEQMQRIKAAYLALRGKRQRERYLKQCAPWVAAQLTGY